MSREQIKADVAYCKEQAIRNYLRGDYTRGAYYEDEAKRLRREILKEEV